MLLSISLLQGKFPWGSFKHKKQNILLLEHFNSLLFLSFNSKNELQFGKGQNFLFGSFIISNSNLNLLYLSLILDLNLIN